jgi:hypothetical protein
MLARECPFCGAKNTELDIKDCYNDEGVAAKQIVCSECYARGPETTECFEYQFSIEKAYELWNRRWKEN